jgi:nitrate reductase gamma subunit
MVFGFCFRLSRFLLDRGSRDVYWARKPFTLPAGRRQIDSHLMHLGIFAVVFGFAPHIVLITDLTGLSWPGLPIGVIWFAGATTVVAMVALMAYRLVARTLGNTGEPSFGVDDYLSWLLVFTPMATGLLAYPHLGGASLTGPYAAILTAHLLGAELLMIWLPFGKLGHLIMMPMLRASVRTAELFRAFTRRNWWH